MSQFDFGNLSSPLSGANFIDNNLEPWRDALHSCHSGATRPSYAVNGLLWLDNSNASLWILKMFQGSTDIVLGSLDPVTNKFTTSTQVLNNITANRNPIVTDDSSKGYTDGSVWINTTTTEVFMAVSVGIGAASWLLISGNVPSGTILDYAGPTAPFGYIFPYGQTLLIADYPTLFNAIGTTYGGNGTTTFVAPDCRGRVIIGKDDMGGSAIGRITAAIAGFIGTVLGAFGGDQRMHQHTHAVNDPGHNHQVTQFAGIQNPFAQNLNSSVAGQGLNRTGNSTTGITIDNAGGGSSQNVQPSIVLNKIMRI